MKIINIVPGFGATFYCGNCLRDSGFTQSLKDLGHEAHTLPIYLPLFAEDCNNEEGVPVFYGAVNIYLKQNFSFFRKMPKWLYNFFDSSPVLKYAAKKAGSTRAHGLEEMTISMLKGHEGYQQEELQQLIDYLRDHEKPDVIHLSNALLLGLAYKIKNELGIPVVCSLQDEDVWIDAMSETYQPKLWQLLSEKAQDVDAFVAVSNYFAALMQQKMQIPREKLHTIYVGIDPETYEVFEPSLNPPVIGYLSRMHLENCFEILIDAFIKLKNESQFTDAKLRLTGGKTGDDKRFINKQIKKLKQNNCYKDVEFIDDFSKEVLNEFFSGLTVLTVPVVKGEAFGLFQLEALASGIPLVQPAVGAFPEIIEATGGGVTYFPNDANALSQKWAEVFSNPVLLQQMSRNGLEAVQNKFHLSTLSQNIVKVYEEIV
jgi:glycosyltransferase involved in cell wall biosynthesis